METKEAILSRRSIRKFSDRPLPPHGLSELIALARLSASAGNHQIIRYAEISKKENRDVVFSALNWAMYLPDFSISEGEEPRGYIILLQKDHPSPFFEFDSGCASSTIMLAAQEMGLASCCLKIARPEILSNAFPFDGYRAVYAIALGYPAIQSKTVPQKESHRYFTDENGNFFVPKLSTEEVTLFADKTI